MKRIALLGDSSDHGGSIISSGQDNSFLVGGIAVAVEGAQHSCPINGHGVTSITAITVRSYYNSKLVLTVNAIAGCGAKITPIDRDVYIE